MTIFLMLALSCADPDAYDAASSNASAWVQDMYPGIPGAPGLAYTLSCRVRDTSEATCSIRVPEFVELRRLSCSTHPGEGCTLLAECPED